MCRWGIWILLLLVMSSCTAVNVPETAPAGMENTETAAEPAVTEENVWTKLHFYLGDEAFQNIEDRAEMDAAFAELKKLGEDTIEITGEPLEITVMMVLTGDFTDTAEYKEMAKQRETLESPEEVRAWREELNAASYAYHSALLEKHMALLPGIGESSWEASGYSPDVRIRMDADAVDKGDFLKLISSDAVINIGFDSFREAVPEISMPEDPDPDDAGKKIRVDA